MDNGTPVEVIFFDIRDTLGEVDSPGHLVPYRPSTEKLLSAMRDSLGLRIGLITNLPEGVDGRKMIDDAVLSQNGGGDVRIGQFIDENALITNHEAGVDKPDPKIFRFAAEKMGVAPERCMFVGENLIEVLGARAAGMHAELKPCPPGREFLPAPLTSMRGTPTDSGRAFEAFFEHEHLLGDRIFACGEVIVTRLKELGSEADDIPDDLYTAMGILIYLTNNFADQAHLKAEEAVVPLAIARGMDPDHAQWVFDHHDQGRAYFASMDIAWRRIQNSRRADDPRLRVDLRWAIDAFSRNTEGFVALFIHHAERENDELYPEMGSVLDEADDTLVINMISHIGPPDFTPYVSLVSSMEEALATSTTAESPVR